MEQRKFEIYATGTPYDTELKEKLEEMGFTSVSVKSIVPQNKLRSLFKGENLSGLGDDCRSVIVSLDEYHPCYDDLLDVCDTDHTIELFDNLAMVLNRHMVEYRANRLLQALMEDTLNAYDERCRRVCKLKKDYHCSR